MMIFLRVSADGEQLPHQLKRVYVFMIFVLGCMKMDITLDKNRLHTVPVRKGFSIVHIYWWHRKLFESQLKFCSLPETFDIFSALYRLISSVYSHSDIFKEYVSDLTPHELRPRHCEVKGNYRVRPWSVKDTKLNQYLLHPLFYRSSEGKNLKNVFRGRTNNSADCW